MSSVTKRGQGRWLGRYRGPDGKERTKTFTTKGEASAWAAAQELRMRTGDWTDPQRGKVTVDAFFELWLASQSGAKESTVSGYKSLYRCHIRPRWGAVRLDRVAYGDVKAWLAGLKTAARQDGPSRGRTSRSVSARPLGAARKRQVYQLFAAILDLAVEDGRLARNPAKSAAGSSKGMVPKAVKKRAHRYLSHEEVHTLADHFSRDARALLLVLAYCGPRWGEATALQVQDVDLLRNKLSVRRAFSDVDGRLFETTPKTHATRVLPLPRFLRAELEGAMQGKSPSDLLFTAPEGGPWRNQNFRARRLEPAIKAAGIERFTIHELRHTAASLAVQSGANVKGVQRMLGHASAAMTLDVYADLFDSDLDGVANRLDEAVSALPADSVRIPTIGAAAHQGSA